MALNFFAYLEHYGGFSETIAAAIFISAVLIVLVTFALSLMPFKAREQSLSETEVELRKKIIIYNVSFIIL